MDYRFHLSIVLSSYKLDSYTVHVFPRHTIFYLPRMTHEVFFYLQILERDRKLLEAQVKDLQVQ